jgi:hypothetical protein
MFLERHTRVAAAIQTKLWDNVTHSFAQLITDGPSAGQFYRHPSFTTLYPLVAKATTDEQATLLVEKFLTNTDKLCVQQLPDGVSKMNTSEGFCWFGATSIAVDDPAFKEQKYVRGR